MPELKDTNPKLLFRLTGLAFTAVCGLLLLTPLGQPLADFSFDASTRFAPRWGATNAVVIYADPYALQSLLTNTNFLAAGNFTPPLRKNWPPDRRIYAPLLNRLKANGARLVFFDFDFSTPRPGEDERFAQAITSITNSLPVILGGVHESSHQQTGANPGLHIRRTVPPNNTLRMAVNDWGILAVAQKGGSRYQALRQIYMGDSNKIAAIVMAAQCCGISPDTNKLHWLNYYGPAYSLDWLPLDKAFDPVYSSVFRRSAVFIGGGTPTASQNEELADAHPTPYTRFGGSDFSGVELLATSYLNLVQGSSLTEASLAMRLLIVVAWAVGTSLIFLFVRDRYMLFVGAAFVLLAIAAGCWTHWFGHYWWPWGICAFVQTPIAAAWAAVANRWRPWPPTAFICYRRIEGEGSGYAFAIWSALELQGYGVACDTRSEMMNKPFRDQLFELIDSVPNFIVVLSKDSLKPERISDPDDVYSEEIEHALKQERNIIQLRTADFDKPKNLPARLGKIFTGRAENHAITWNPEEPFTAVQKVIKLLHRPSFFHRLLYVFSARALTGATVVKKKPSVAKVDVVETF